MPCPASGAISIQSLVDEFGGSAPHSMSEYYRNGGLVPGNNTNVPESGEFSLTDCYSAVNEVQHTHSDGDTHANYATLFGSNWASTVPKRVIVPSGVTVGGTTTHAMLVPSGMGGTLVFDISGNVHGHGGAANGGNGGNAIHCIQTSGVTININSGAEVKAGGGGGGQGGAGGSGGAGGTGGAGGAGGMGYYWSSSYGGTSYIIRSLTSQRTGNPCYSMYRHSSDYPGGNNTYSFTNECYNGSYFQSYGSGSNYESKPWGACSFIYSLGCSKQNGKTPSCFSTFRFIYEFNSLGDCEWESTGCIKRLFQNGGTGGAGGAGGSGGAGSSGGAGGVGQGYNQSAGSGGSAGSASAGAGGSAGSAGSSSSNNAGTGGSGGSGGQGGTGGQGGSGGSGGAFGSSGSSGAAGNTGSAGNDGAAGNTGANGNTYNGAAGSAGGSGTGGSSGSSASAGGAAGYYIYNRASITLNNSGTVAGQ